VLAGQILWVVFPLPSRGRALGQRGHWSWAVLGLYQCGVPLLERWSQHLWSCVLWQVGVLVSNGMELGARLNLFSMVCAGHHNTKDILLLAEGQDTVEAGAAREVHR